LWATSRHGKKPGKGKDKKKERDEENTPKTSFSVDEVHTVLTPSLIHGTHLFRKPVQSIADRRYPTDCLQGFLGHLGFLFLSLYLLDVE